MAGLGNVSISLPTSAPVSTPQRKVPEAAANSGNGDSIIDVGDLPDGIIDVGDLPDGVNSGFDRRA